MQHILEARVNGDGSKLKRKNLNLSAKVFKRMERLKKRQARDERRPKVSWDVYMDGVADREEGRA